MRFRILTIFPELFETFLATSLVGRAIERGLLEVEVRNLREFARDRHRSVDDEPYGGGGGMVMLAEPWLAAVRTVVSEGEGEVAGARSGPLRILLSPQGKRLDDAKVRELAAIGDFVLLCGRYEAIDERVLATVVDEEISIGDYVLSGGELPAMVLLEALSRQIPGVVQLAGSVENDSFRGGLLDHPHYTRPAEVEGLPVPPVLLSGDHAAIDAWRAREALRATLRKRPDLLVGAELDPRQRGWLAELQAENRADRRETAGERPSDLP
jgi:tRNA (guanine37-N1)-methyltransferase